MIDKKGSEPVVKSTLHPRNPHRFRYDFKQLIIDCPPLEPFIIKTKYGTESIDFSDPDAVKMLNRAILKHFYHIGIWDLPQGYLCPPIPGRADYIHYVADLLADCNNGVIPSGPTVEVLDIGVGANCVYPIIGNHAYGWHFVGSDIDPVAIDSANQIIKDNTKLQGEIECRLQNDPNHLFKSIVHRSEFFDLTICNPPFHSSAQDAASGTQRKIRNLTSRQKSPMVLNFGGQNNELWCDGGEAGFVSRMILESHLYSNCCLWFTTLISKKTNLPGVYKLLRQVGAKKVKTIEMAQGQKHSRVVAWSFLSDHEIAEWVKRRWMKNEGVKI